MTVVLGVLFLVGLESNLQLKLIPNNIRYKRPFKNSNLNIAIISNSGEFILNTLNKIEIPVEIIEDIKANKPKDNYYDEFQVLRITNGYAISKREIEGIKKLKEEINNKNIELKKQQKLLINEQNVKQKLHDIKVKNQINEELEDNIKEKKDEIEKLLNSSKIIDKKELSQIKLLVGYCKRMGTLVISTHNSEKFSLERVRIILDELLEDFKVKDIDATYVINDIITLSSMEMSDLYNTIFEILRNVENVGVLIIIKKVNNLISLKFRIDKEISKINIDKEFAFYLEINMENYHQGNILGMSIYDGEKAYILDEKAVLLNKDIFKNAVYTYDLKKSLVVLNKFGIEFENVNFDTMIACYLLNYNIKEDISYISNVKGYNIEFFTNLIKKGEILDKGVFMNNLALKSKFIYDTREEYINELTKEEMLELFNNVEMPLVRVLSKMELNGIRVNIETLDIIKKRLGEKLNLLSNRIYELAGETFNISSPKQLGEILFEKLDLPHKPKRGRNGYSTNHDTLMKLYDTHEIIPLILEYRNLIKLMTTYMDNLKDFVMSDGKIHTIFKQTITRTGRLSSAEPNLQNIPIRTEEGKEIRKAFLPEHDSVILTSDYSQIELRILAHISGCQNLINAFNNSEDIHTKVASDIYGVPTNEVTKTMRRTAKAVIFGIVYGISGFGLGENLDISPKEAKKYIDKYLTMYPGVKSYMDNIKIKAKEQGYVRTIMNRKREIDELKNTNYIIVKSGERMALNTPIQGSAADIIKKAMIEVDNELTKRNLKSKMLIQVHDELVFTVPKDEIEIMKELVRNVMENAYNLEVPLKVDIELGDNWYDAK